MFCLGGKCLSTKLKDFHICKVNFESSSDKICRAMCYLVENKNKVCSRTELEDFIWEGHEIGKTSLPVIICDLREILENTNLYIKNIRHKGYILKTSK